jgi:hypothetical protein
MKKVEVLNLVQNSVSSIFSKEDVINLIKGVDEVKGKVITTQDIERAIDKTISWIENNERDFIDLDSAELEMDYNNKVSCVGVPIDVDCIKEALENNFGDFGQDEEEDEEEFVRVTDVVAENEL